MAAVGIVQLAERLLNQNNTQSQDTQNTQRVTSHSGNQGPQATAQDQFTPSAQAGQGAAQEAGLFSVAQFSFFSAAAEFLLAQNTPPANQPAAATPLLTPPTVLNAPPAGPLALPLVAPAATQPQATATTAAAAANTPNAAGPAAAATTGVGAATGAPTAQGPLAIEQQLATLNQSLVALGLSPQEIQQLDRIASVINDFNPLAFTSLAFQLEQLAQLSAPQAGATAPATTENAGNAANPNAAANSTAGNQGPGAGGGFRVQELIIQFSGVQGLVNAAGNGAGHATAAEAPGAGANTALGVSAFNLQIEEVNLTLANANGQTAQIQAPQRAGKAAHEAGANPPAPAGKARATAA